MYKDMKTIDSIDDIIDKYAVYIIDVYGVIYDGINLMSPGLSAIYKLMQKGKKITFLSNSSRPSDALRFSLLNVSDNEEEREVLTKTPMCTGGDFFLEYVIKNFSKGGNRKIFLYGEGRTHPVIEKMQRILIANGMEEMDITSDITKAGHFMLFLPFILGDKQDAKIRMCLRESLENSLPFLCPNPDFSAPHGKGRIRTPGYYGNLYEEMGGEVIFFGKPYEDIYSYALNKLFNKDLDFDVLSAINKKTTLMIGDSLGNDVLGAYNVGIDSLFIGRANTIPESRLYPTYNIDFLR